MTRCFLTLLLGAALLGRAMDTLTNIPLLPADDVGVAEAGTLRIGARVGERDGLLAFGIQDGRHLSFEEGTRGFTMQDSTEGGATVTNLNYIEFPLAVAGGTYQVWYRAFFPRVGNWLHFERMDDGPTVRSIDNPNDPALSGKWVWAKGPVYELTAGDHLWQLDGWRGGAQLDRVVFSRRPDVVPDALGPASTAELVADTASFSSGELAPGVKRWGTLSWTLAGSGAAKVWVSPDAKTWTEVASGADLGAVASRPALYLRVVLAAGADGGTPIVQNLALTYEPDPALWRVLENDRARLVFTPLGLREIVDPRTGTGFRNTGAATEFFGFTAKAPGHGKETEYLAGRDAASRELVVRGDTLRGTYTFFDGKLTMRPEIRLEADGASRWFLQVDNDSDLEVTGLRYPYLRAVRVGADGADDTLTIPCVWGQIIRNPAKWTQRYPTTPLVRFMDLYDPAGALYVADHHADDRTVNDLAMYARPSEDGSAVDLSLVKFFRVAPGEQRTFGPYVVALHDGDWHGGADRYREEVVAKLRCPGYPAWWWWADGWTSANGFWPTRGVSVLSMYGDVAREDGLPFMGGNRLGVSSTFVGYGGFWPAPTPLGGSAAEVRQAFDEVREYGGDGDFYIAWNLHSADQAIDRPRVAGVVPRQLFGPETKFYPLDWAEHNASRPADGELGDFHGLKSQLRMCPGADGWRQYLEDWTRIYARDYHAFIYFDCTSIGIAYGLAGICENLAHGHDDYGVYYRATVDELDRVHRIAREIDPDWVCSGEGCNDLTGQTGIIHMASGVVNHTEVFRYTVPDQILVDGAWNSGCRPRLGGIERYNHVFLTGCRFDGVPQRQSGTRAELATTADYGHALLALRRQTRQYLYPARFMDTVGLELRAAGGATIANPVVDPAATDQVAPVDGIQAKWFKLAAGDQQICLVNTLNTPGRQDVSLRVAAARVGPVRAAWAFALDGSLRRLPVARVDDCWQVPLPAAKLATVVLVDRAFPALRIPGTGVTVTTRGQTVAPRVHVTNLEPTAATAELSWELPRGCRGETITVANLQPGETRVVAVPFTVGERLANRRYDLWLRTTWRGRRDCFYHRLSVTEPITVRLREGDDKNLVVRVHNVTAAPLAVAGTLDVEAPLTPSQATVTGMVAPGAVWYATVPLAGWDAVVAPLRARLQLTGGGVTVHKSLLMYPFVPNGDFEIDLVGDGYPEYWAGWSGRGVDDFAQFARRDTTRHSSGAASLRLEPYPEAGVPSMAQPMVARLKANTRYRVGIDIWRPEATPEVYFKVERLTLGKKDVEAGKWQHFEGEFAFVNPTRFPDRDPAYDWVRWLRCFNNTDQPAWFDNLTITEITD